MDQFKKRLGAFHELLSLAEFTIFRVALFLMLTYALWRLLSHSHL